MPTYNQKEGQKLSRFEIPMFDGLNMIVGENLAKRTELGFIENARSERIGWMTKRPGYTLLGQALGADFNYGLFDFLSDSHLLIRVSGNGSAANIYTYNIVTEVWDALIQTDSAMTPAECSFANANNCCFIVNGTDLNRYILQDKTTVRDSSYAGGQLYNSPKAHLINYFRGRLYIGDYYNIDGTRSRTWIAFSSPLLGIASLVSGDQSAPITTLNVTTSQYILPTGAGTDTVDFYRGATLLGSGTVTGRSATTLTFSSPLAFSLQSSDEIWIGGTHDSTKVFRWDNRSTGTNAKEYDSFQNLSNEDLTLITNIDMIQLICTPNSISAFDGTNIRPLSLDIGVCSSKSFAHILGQGVFLHYTGIYSISSGSLPRLLTSKIQQIFDNADPQQLEQACAAANNFSYFVSIGDVPFYNTNGSLKRTMRNVVIEYNFRQNNVFVHSGIAMTNFVSYIQNSQKYLVFTYNNINKFAATADTITCTESVSITII